MTIDERLEKLAERTDAIAQSVELLTSLHLDSERRYSELVARNEERYGKYEERFAKTEERMAQLMETMNRLANIVITHEQRLDDLEDRPH
jgi:chromosome segregation ATPase